jgi:hypothetical protein
MAMKADQLATRSRSEMSESEREDFDEDVAQMIEVLGGIITRNEVIGLPSTIIALRKVLDYNLRAYATLVEDWESELSRH